MTPSLLPDLRALFEGSFRSYRSQDWAIDWHRKYCEQVRLVQNADWETWRTPSFQRNLWDSAAIASIGPGHSVTVVGAYDDENLARKLFDARGSLDQLKTDEKGALLQKLFDDVIARVYPAYSGRRPKARLSRLFAAVFPDDMTSIADANRIWGVQRILSAQRLPGDFITQHPAIRAKMRDALGMPATVEDKVDQAIFAWFLWQEFVEKPDEGAVVVQTTQRESSAVPPFSLLPANAQRRSLTCVKGNVALLLAMVREAEQGIGREDLVGVILSEATQLNVSSAGNIISQAMGGLGLIRLDGNAYRPTERGQELLAAGDPAQVLRGPLVGRVFGMGHLLLMVQREPGKLRPSDAAKLLQDLVPTWASTQPGSHICTWARIVGLIDLDSSAGGGRLVLTDDGEDYAAALPEDFEKIWRLPEEEQDPDGAGADVRSVAGFPAVRLPEATNYDAHSIVADGCFLPTAEIEAAVELLRRKKNLVLQGPPGTGKTWLAKRLGYALIGARDPERLAALQFQPTLSYEDFVRGWRPDGTGGLKLADGIFLDAVSSALADPTRPYVLVIEEINRGNPAQILGEMLTLLENGKRTPEEALRLAYPRTVDERVFVPDNLYLIGTMNLADRSLALVDLALRRRFAFITLSPLFNAAWKSWLLEQSAPVSLVNVIAERMVALNNAIADERTLGVQFQVGHSFVTPISAPGSTEEAWRSWYSETVDTEIAPLLREYWYDDIAAAEVQIKKLRITN